MLSADFAQLGQVITMLDRSECDWIHIDVMDGCFVPNITLGPPIIKAIRPYTKKIFDVHLMIAHPERYIEEFARAGADILTVHYEACVHLHRVVEQIRAMGIKPAVAINPHTPVYVLEDILPYTEMILVMSVNPGFGGQQFIENTYEKVTMLRRKIEARNLKTLIEVDGGVTLSNAVKLKEVGADVLVAGNAIFKAESVVDTIRQFKAL